MSKQREAILKAVSESCVHPNAETIYAIVKEELPNISLGTVYRNLGVLSEQGIIRRIPVPFGSDRFDKTTYSHGHIVCPKCGCVSDLPKDITDSLECMLGQARYELTVQKECEKCK